MGMIRRNKFRVESEFINRIHVPFQELANSQSAGDIKKSDAAIFANESQIFTVGASAPVF